MTPSFFTLGESPGVVPAAGAESEVAYTQRSLHSSILAPGYFSLTSRRQSNLWSDFSSYTGPSYTVACTKNLSLHLSLGCSFILPIMTAIAFLSPGVTMP